MSAKYAKSNMSTKLLGGETRDRREERGERRGETGEVRQER